MENHEYVQYCLTKKGAYIDYPFGPKPMVIKVMSKMFALISTDEEVLKISLKCDPDIANDLRNQYESVVPGYHLNKQHWNTVIIDDSIPTSEIQWMIDLSYTLVVKGLKKQEKTELESL
ncbi:MmcQ/YjbR family DNA-binding protein [Fervidibacillus albus]|uniref:MmcQ/YjbR family DNA-binding protein n=1 Tax=Fervidibacillus albus TaxID=2980026 RepID=A0A9E8LT70_9BACI|nr:MmcQ/YjbR family DNA-binding protein [Fervidibacillus albus]WAA09082.1 MmcQ/YjbR family DNA-binding protein [Fervidibacillus albus]